MSNSAPKDCWPELRAIPGVAALPLPWPVRSARRIGLHVSQRRFYRLLPGGDEPTAVASVVLVLYAHDDPEAVSRYERVARWFGTAGVRVPRVFGTTARALLVEDGGDLLLAECDASAALEARYEEAARIIGALQDHGLLAAPPNPDLQLDRDRLRFELDVTEEHAVQGWQKAGSSSRRDRAFDRLAGAVAALPRRLCHRDFHSRNLLVDGDLMVVDFQDAMSGPLFYDLASLLCDDYRDVPDGCAARATGTFWGGIDAPLRVHDGFGVPDAPETLPPAARQGLALTAAQRSLKALGTFGYQVGVAGRPEYADYARRTWRHARRSLAALGLRELIDELAVFDRI